MTHALLATRSSFSVGQSSLTIKKLVKEATAVGASAVALTDEMSITAMIDFNNRCREVGIKPIIGCRLRFVDDVTWRKTKDDRKTPPEWYMTWYTRSEAGMKALFRLLSLANSEERFYFTSKLAFQDLYDALAPLTGEDVAIASGDARGVVSHPQASQVLERVKGCLGAENTFLTLTPTNTPYWDTMNVRAIVLAQELELPTLVSRPCFYPRTIAGKADEADALDVLGAIISGDTVTSTFFKRPHARDMHALSAEDLAAEVAQMTFRLQQRGVKEPMWLTGAGFENARTFADTVTYEWKKSAPSLPKMAPDEFARVVELCREGWTKRFAAPVFGHVPAPEDRVKVYAPRLKYELSVLKALGFSGYFLLVHDVVNFARSNGIRTGTGRGSVGGSLVSYLMGITDCDPIRFNLLFERFINPERIDLPDADLDFMSERRSEIFEYLIRKYGREKVAGVSNFLDLKTKSAIRDVSKAKGLSEFDYRCSKLAPSEHGMIVPLKEVAERIPEIGEFAKRYKGVWDTCLQLEGVTRTFGRHAAGVVVAECDLVERAVVERRKEKAGEEGMGAVVCFDKRMVEDQGLIKMDVLGLSTLDLHALTLEYIWKRRMKRVNLMEIALDDPKVLTEFASGNTTAVFQFDGGGMRRLLRQLGHTGEITFDDITAATALYRPGPMDSGMMDSYWKRKQGIEEVAYDHPALEAVTSETFGVLVYQEQVMQAARDVAGYSMAGADKLRKIMGKKLPEEMKKEEGKFVAGCVATVGMSEAEAQTLFDKIAKFAAYGFNKSHSVAYTLISYQSAWLKTHFTVEFFAAALTLLKQDKLPAILADAIRLGIDIELPDVNLSTNTFEILTDAKLCIPFPRIKGLTERTGDAILEARKAGKFANKADFEARCRGRNCNVGHITKLDQIGAFASIEPGSLPARHDDRVKIQRDLIPGLITDYVPIYREMHSDEDTRASVNDLVNDYRNAPELREDGIPVQPFFGDGASFMVITDAPSNGEEQKGQITDGRSFTSVADGLAASGLSRADGYFTSLIKRPKADKQVSPEEIRLYGPWLQREINLLKPTIIVLMGSSTVRHFIPDFKGKASEFAGEVIYEEKVGVDADGKPFDANLVVGFNPGEAFFDESKHESIEKIFTVASILRGATRS